METVSLSIIFIVAVFNENHTENNTLIMNHKYRNYGTTIQCMGDSYSQVRKQVNNDARCCTQCKSRYFELKYL